ncbi:hypothetical protein [Clostridium sp. Marseille-Q2269]|uniref:hypothetical protein n=1 Tax=Clostridium sp. Marseille-Q2269 TaxID=2942205 RepID=UPI0020740E95|nr:hypothetical protein [Clostridium sp. Marseille-Q2269]
MKIKNNLKCQWNIIRRNKMYYIYVLIMYFILAFFDQKNKVYMPEMDDYIFRYNYQQVCIVFSSIIVTMMLINEDFIKLFEDFIRLYIKDSKIYFYSALMLLSFAHIVPFILGQLLVLVINYLYFGTVPIKLFLVNIIIVSIEIVVSNLLAMSLNLIIKNKVLVYLSYFIIITTLLVINNVYVSIPLNISILESEGFYITFAYPLWIGRIILIIISGILFHYAVKKIVSERY